jgi:hypothetical protein
MLAGIITENEHQYNALLGSKSKFIRMISDKGYITTSKGACVYVTTHIQEIDEQGNETLVRKIDSESDMPILYTNEELDSFFSSFNDPIEPTESFTAEFKRMLEGVLLQDTMAKNYFNGDTCVPYEPTKTNL